MSNELIVTPGAGQPVEQSPAAWSAAGGYEAITEKYQRRAPRVATESEDVTLPQADRRKLQATVRDLRRNYALAGWMIRRHLDYVTRVEFESQTESAELNDWIEERFRRWSRPPSCDARGSFSLFKMIRTAEASAVVDGDCGIVPLRSGHLAAIEGDRIRNPQNRTSADRWVNGVRINRAGRPVEYGIWSRRNGGQSFDFERTIRADNLFLHAYRERFDQTRGVSPINAAINDLVDLKEAKTYALLKQKVAQFFGLILKRQADDAVANVSDEGEDETGQPIRPRVDLNNGPFTLDMEPDDAAEFLSVDTPGTSFADFHKLVVLIALTALDLPITFLDPSWTNYSGARGAWLIYQRSAFDKRENVAELLRKITVRKYQQWIAAGELPLPAGWSIDDLAFSWSFVGLEWFDKVKEITADIMAINAGLNNPQRVSMETGKGNYYRNVDATLEAKAYWRRRSREILGQEEDPTFDVSHIVIGPDDTPPAAGG